MPLPTISNLKSALSGDALTYGLLYWVMLISFLGNAAMMSLFPAIGRESGIPDALIVSAQSVSALISVVAMPFWASQSDRVGRKPIILLGAAGFAIASLLTSAAVYAATHHVVAPILGLLAIIASRSVYGGFGLASSPAIQAYISDRTTPERRTSTLASMASAQGVGSIIGPGLAPFLILPFIGLAGPQLVLGVVALAVWVLVARHLPRDVPVAAAKPKTAKTAVKGLWRRPNVWPFLAYMATLAACNAASIQMIGFVVIDTLGKDPIQAQPYAGGAIMAGAIGSLVVQLVLIRAFRLQPPRLMLLGGALAALGSLLMAFSSHYVAIAAAFTLANIGFAFGRPGALAGASLSADPDKQGATAGLLSSASTSGLIFSPVLAMTLYHVWRPTPFLAIAAAMGAVALLAALNTNIKAALPGGRRP